jgi:hypothetical protein
LVRISPEATQKGWLCYLSSPKSPALDIHSAIIQTLEFKITTYRSAGLADSPHTPIGALGFLEETA